MHARQARDIGDINPLPFVAMVFNCIGWIGYACLLQDFFLFFANIIGLVLGLFYSIVCLTLLAKQGEGQQYSQLYLTVERLLLFALFFWSLMGLLAGTLFNQSSNTRKESANLVGLLSCAFSIAYYAAPLSTMVEIIRTKDSSSLFLPMIMVNLVNAIMWFLYGAIAKHDINIWGPNGLGAILSTIQIMLLLLYSKHSWYETLTGKGHEYFPVSSKVKSESIKSTGDNKSPIGSSASGRISTSSKIVNPMIDDDVDSGINLIADGRNSTHKTVQESTKNIIHEGSGSSRNNSRKQTAAIPAEEALYRNDMDEEILEAMQNSNSYGV